MRSERLGLVLGLLALSLFTIALRVAFLRVPMISDEGGYAYVAHFWAQGYQIYRDLPFDRPQGIFLIYRAILAGLGSDVIAIRVAGALRAALTAIAIFFTARALFTLRAGVVAALLFAVFGASPSIEGFTANAELFANLPLVLAAYFCWKERWAAAGLLAGLACLIKPSGVSALLLVLGWALYRRAGVRALAAAVAAFALAPLGSLLHGLSVGWDAYIASLVHDRLLAFSVVTTGADTQFHRFLNSSYFTSPAWLAPALLAGLGLLSAERKAAYFGVAWLSCTLAGMAIGGNWNLHYYMQLIPPLAVFAGAARFGTGLRRAAAVSILALALLHFAAQDALLWPLPPDEISQRMYERPGYVFGQQIADVVAAHTKPSDTIYVAFAEAHLYYLARRRAVAPQQMYWNQAQYNKRAFDAALDAVKQRKPAMLIWSQPPPHWIKRDDFKRIVDDGYRFLGTIGGIGLFERKPG